MIRKSIQLLLLFTLLIGAKKLCAQKTFDVKIQLPVSLQSKGFLITYDNGVKTYPVADSFVNSSLEFHGTFASKYANLNIKYTVNDSISFDGRYFIGTKPAEFYFLPVNNILDKNPFHNCKIKNAIEIDESKMAIKRSVYSRDAISQMNVFWKTNAPLVGRVDSITHQFYNNLDNVNREDLGFVRRNKDDYFSFWWFRKTIVPSALMIHNNDSTEIQNLLNFLNTVFPKKFTDKPEGQELRALLRGKLFVKKNTLAPVFEIKDIQGDNINLKNYRGKYVLLDFWASWCAPCRQMAPHLKELYKKYHSKDLEIISISVDTDSNLWKEAVKDEGLNSWINILSKDYDQNNKQAAGLDITYGINGYPTTILINRKGDIIGRYVGYEVDDSKSALDKILNEVFK